MHQNKNYPKIHGEVAPSQIFHVEIPGKRPRNDGLKMGKSSN